MSSDRLKADCLTLMGDACVMSLSTCDREGAWSAPVYYIYRQNAFYFFSNPKARHVNGDAKTLCAASIFRDDARIENLCGIQMQGRILTAEPGTSSLKVAAAYCRRFAIQAGKGDLLSFFKESFHASLYRFVPELIFFMNNAEGFGKRERVDL